MKKNEVLHQKRALVAATLANIERMAQREFETVASQQRHLVADYARLQSGIAQLTNLTVELRSSLQTLSETMTEKGGKRNLGNEIKVKPLHREIGEAADGQFLLTKEFKSLGLLDAKTIRRMVMPLLEQVPMVFA